MNNQMIQVEMHLHTKETSLCGKVGAKDLIKLYKKAGYKTLVVTDHYNQRTLESFHYNTNKEKVDRFLSGYNALLKYGDRLGINILLGIEACLVGNRNDYLIYGINKEFLYHNPKLYFMTQEQLYNTCCKYNALMYQAHPFRNYCTPSNPLYLHGVEVFNGNSNHNDSDGKASEWAHSNHLLQISGSDCHVLKDIGNGGIILPSSITTEKSLVNYLKNNSVDLIKNS